MSKLATKILLFISSIVGVNAAYAERTLTESTIEIGGQQRRYFRLNDTPSVEKPTPILLINGSGCQDFAARIPTFFRSYPVPVDVYFLEKSGIEKGDNGEHCSEVYNRTDYLGGRVNDALEFIEAEPHLKSLDLHSVAILGFSEGGVVAPVVASRSGKIGWLAIAGSGGLSQSEEFLILSGRKVEQPSRFYSREQLFDTYAAIKADPDNTDKDFFGHPYRYWSSHLFYDPLPTFAELSIPILVAMGEKDDSVPIESGRMLQDYFASHPNNKFTFIEYMDAGHALRAPHKDNLPDFIAGLSQWLKGKPFPVGSDNL